MIQNLSPCEEPLIKPTIVLDARVATETNIRWLKENQYTYLVVSRKKEKDLPGM